MIHPKNNEIKTKPTATLADERGNIFTHKAQKSTIFYSLVTKSFPKQLSKLLSPSSWLIYVFQSAGNQSFVEDGLDSNTNVNRRSPKLEISISPSVKMQRKDKAPDLLKLRTDL